MTYELPGLTVNLKVRAAHTHLHHTGHDPVLGDARCVPQPSGERVHGSDVSDEQVLQVRGLSAHLGVEVEAPRLQTALFNDGLEQMGTLEEN